jgi:hypothetical protein
MKMKKLIATMTMMALLISSNVNAQVQQNGGIRQAVDQMVASIEKSLGIFDGFTHTEAEKLAEFDKILEDIDYCVQLTERDGTLSKRIAYGISLAHKQAEYCKKKAETKSGEVHTKWLNLAAAATQKASDIQKNAEKVLEINAELAALRPKTEDEKELFHAAVIIGKLDEANKSLENVTRTMKRVVTLLKESVRIYAQM